MDANGAPSNAFSRLLQSPLIAAPMAGGVTTVDLALAVTRGGGFSFLAAGYRRPDELAAEIAAFRSASQAAFGVNLFLPARASDPSADVRAYARLIRPEAVRLGVDLGEPGRIDDYFSDKIELLLPDPVPVASFTFGLPNRAVVSALHAVGTVVIATVTDVVEAAAAAATDVDLLWVQSAAAGGHRATFDNTAGSSLALPDLLKAVRAATELPMIAAGGLGGSDQIARALQAGAIAAAAGTAFLAATESGASAGHKAALAAPQTRTALTRAFTGRPARAIVNRFAQSYGGAAPAAYPQVHQLTAPLRRAGAERGDASVLALWAGTGHQQARTASAQAIAADLLGRL